MEKVIALGFVLLMAGTVLVATGIALNSFKTQESEMKGAGIFLVGPIPIVFGDRKLVVPLLLLSIALMVAWIFLSKH
jgi:uncharacterized protein (TIGR00304 family)